MIVWHRKAHKTTLAINELHRWASAVRGTYWYVAPFYNQAKKIVWQDPEMMPKYINPEIWEKRNNSELYITYPNGSVLYVMGADKPDSLRGPNPRGVILDEYGDMKPEIWAGIIQPIMTANPDAWCWFMGTPKGKNDFYQKYIMAGENPNWMRSLLKASDSGIISQEALKEAKKTTTEAFYKQEYECDFLDNASAVFRRVRNNLWDGNLEPQYYHSYQLGIDLAKYDDWTVITPVDKNTFKVGNQDRFNKIDWNLQVSRIEANAYKFYHPILKVDSTGVGDPICETLVNKGLNVDPVEGIKFTELSRKQLLENLAILLEHDKIKIPNNETLLNELESFSYKLTENKRIKMEVPEGMHDDCVMSLALAVWGLSEPLGEPKNENMGMYATDYD